MKICESLRSQLIGDKTPLDPASPSDALTPPRKLIDVIGGGDFDVIGREFFRHFTGIGGLQPQHRVLDVGCGCGRMAVPLISFLKGTGEYWGFDIVPAAIQWSRENITARHPQFHFELADIFNKVYNPKGKKQSGEYHFPHPDKFFDFTFLTSVFTHMLAAHMEHYLSEIARTLKPGGRCLISFFLLNAESRGLMERGQSNPVFRHSFPDCVVSNADAPEAAVAYDEQFIRQRLGKHGLQLVEPVHYGSWPGRKKFLSYQDILLATRP